MKHALKSATLVALLGLAGCDTLGDGNTIEKMEIRPVSRGTQLQAYEQGGTYKVLQCLRDELIVVATFSDGSEVNFSSRATWSSSDPAVVQVSDGDIPFVLATNSPTDDGNFYEHATLEYAPGTLVPRGTPGQSAVIRAKFAGLTAAINVEIREPSLRIVPVPTDAPTAVVDPVTLGQGSVQRLTVLLDVDGRTVPLADLFGAGPNSLNINPLRWVLTGGTFDPEDEEVSGDFDRWVITDGADEVVTLQTSSVGDGVVTGFQSGGATYEVTAESSLCDDPSTVATLRPQANVKIGTFVSDPDTAATTDTLVLAREPGFNAGNFAVEDFVIGTSHQLEARTFVEDDAATVTEQIFTQQARYIVLPFNGACTDQDELLGCTTNLDFSASSTGLVRTKAPTEGDDARVHACFPLCLLPTASLEIDDADGVVGSGATVTFTATAIDPPPNLALRYVFDFGDGTVVTPGAAPYNVATHTYADGRYTATVRIIDAAFADEFLGQNRGAVRILSGVGAVSGNDAPVAALSVTGLEGSAPFTTVLNASGSTDADAGDAITVYEFHPGDGSVIRQAEPTLAYTYFDGTGGPFTPTVIVYDQSGAASAPASDATDGEVTVDGVAPAVMWSDAVPFQARDATLCSVELLPDAAADATEAAFTFPSLRFQAVGSFVADTDTDTCDDPVIGEQLITRFVSWRLRHAGDADTVPTIAQIANSSDDFRVPGQVLYFENVPADPGEVLLDVSAVPFTPFTSAIEPTPTTLTITPCAGCTP